MSLKTFTLMYVLEQDLGESFRPLSGNEFKNGIRKAISGSMIGDLFSSPFGE